MLIDYLKIRGLPDPRTHRIYFDYGTEEGDTEVYQDRMDAVMAAAGYAKGNNWVTRSYPGHRHSEEWWRARAPVYLEFLLPPLAADTKPKP